MLFEPLVHMPQEKAEPNRPPYTSLGLGLFIVREIVRGHDGTIAVESSPTLEPHLRFGCLESLRTELPLSLSI
jgi:signal transduction histidine kinase